MRKGLILATLFTLSTTNSFAQTNEEVLRELQLLKQKIQMLEKQLKEKNKREEEVAKEVEEIKEKLGSLEIHGGVRLYYQGASVGTVDGESLSNPSGTGYNADLKISFKPNSNGQFYLRLHGGSGKGADEIFDKKDDVLFANLNTLADDNPENEGEFRLLEAYYSREFFDGKLNLVVGKTEPFIMIDDNEYANDETTQFVGKPFVNNPILDGEDIFAPMLGVSLSPVDKLEIDAVVQSNDQSSLSWNGKEWVVKDKDIYSSVFDKPFYAVQLKYSPEIGGLPGNYRIYYWNDSAEHIKINEPTDNSNRKPSTGDGWGVGISIDQKISENVGVFARASWANDDVYEVEQFYSLGASIDGIIPSRPKDTLGLGVAALIPNDKLKNDDTEYHFEGYYRIEVSENFHITPDIQYVVNPHGNSDNDNIFAGMVRAEFRAEFSF